MFDTARQFVHHTLIWPLLLFSELPQVLRSPLNFVFVAADSHSASLSTSAATKEIGGEEREGSQIK